MKLDLKKPNQHSTFMKFKAILSLFVIIPVFALAQSANDLPKGNQLGYYPQAPKIMITPQMDASGFVIRNTETDEVVYEGDLVNGGTHSPSGETVKIADFSDFDDIGRFVLEIEDGETSYPFYVGDNVFEGVTDAVLKALYFNRASLELDEEYAGTWARPLGHPDNEVQVHNSAATEQIPANTTISSPGGWYDAGDYNKYIVPISVSIYQMLFAYQQFPEFFEEQNLNIPESNNEIPDVLDESLYALRWMFTMQDPNDGGVYHKLTTANFAGGVMPHLANAQRYVVQKTSTATFDFAAVMAQAARVYESILPDFADSALAAAELAWQWGEANPEVYYNQGTLSDPAINTGAYGDGNTSDEQFWAATELYITTGNDEYYDKTGWNNTDIGNPGWSDVRALGLYSLVHHRKNLTELATADTSALKQKLINSFSWYVDDAKNSPYRTAAGVHDWQYYWGSNGGFGNLAMAFLQIYQITDDQDYYDATIHVIDYLLGRNPLGHSYITGYGDLAPMEIHHRQSYADGIADPVPGWVAGGANPDNQNQDCGASAYSSELPALSYLDDWCSYSTNEITTYWNSPVIYALSGLEALTAKSGLNVSNGERGMTIPKKFELEQNYPNPFNPSTRIEYSIKEPSETTLAVYDLGGRLIQELVNEKKSPGSYSVTFNASALSSGVYLYKLMAQNMSLSRKMVLIK